MPDTTPIREHNFGEGPNRAKHSGYAHKEAGKRGPTIGIVDPSAKGTSADARLRRHRFARGLYRLQALHRPRGFRSNSRRVARLQPTTRGSAAQLLGLSGNVDGWAPRLRSSTRLQAGSSIASTHATYTSCAAQKMMAQRCTSVSPSTVPRLATITAPTSAPTGLASCLSKGCTSSFGRAARSDHHTFEIEFLDPGVHAYSFTFG